MEGTTMLVLTRKPGEAVRIGADVTVRVLSVQGNKIRLGVAAPDDVRVLRAEVAPHGTPTDPPPTPAPAALVDCPAAWRTLELELAGARG
jgi:carbon storage regulator